MHFFNIFFLPLTKTPTPFADFSPPFAETIKKNYFFDSKKPFFCSKKTLFFKLFPQRAAKNSKRAEKRRNRANIINEFDKINKKYKVYMCDKEYFYFRFFIEN